MKGAGTGAPKPDFPSFSEGLSLRAHEHTDNTGRCGRFPFLFGGTFIEGDGLHAGRLSHANNFPSFSEGLSLRVRFAEHALTSQRRFPFLFGGTFIEARIVKVQEVSSGYFPSFSEGLSLRH